MSYFRFLDLNPLVLALILTLFLRHSLPRDIDRSLPLQTSRRRASSSFSFSSTQSLPLVVDGASSFSFSSEDPEQPLPAALPDGSTALGSQQPRTQFNSSSQAQQLFAPSSRSFSFPDVGPAPPPQPQAPFSALAVGPLSVVLKAAAAEADGAAL